MAKLLENKAAIVTGGSQGLGLAIATALGIDGARVLVVSRSEEKVRAAAEKVRHAGGEAAPLAADITRPGAAAAIVNAALSQFGRLDILVNSAGVLVWKKFFDLEADDWARTLATNLSAPFFLTQEAARAMAGGDTGGGRGGSVVNIASIHSSFTDPHVVPQCASKTGLVGLTRACARALREFDIRVNAIAPGLIEPGSADRRGESPQRKVTQADVSTMAVYLSSDLARSISGAVIEMYGSTQSVIKI
jgi:NAD(P)-dependent dehydrogenase (short-subunit alcohol dehydrogenase family)